MKEVKVICPKCGVLITYKNWFSWILHTPFHWFDFSGLRDYRRTKCPKCGKISYMKREK